MRRGADLVARALARAGARYLFALDEQGSPRSTDAMDDTAHEETR